MKLNLGCGFDKMDGYINIDIDPRCCPDMEVDLTGPLPFEDNSVEKIAIHQTLEHIHNAEALMLEMWRVLEPGGEVHVSVPLWPCRNSVAGHGHVRQFSLESFLIWTNPRFYQPKKHSCDAMGKFDLVTAHVAKASMENSKDGEFITDLYVRLKKVDRKYWQAQGVQKGLETDVLGCFWCQVELDVKSETAERVVKICPVCAETYEIVTKG